MLRVLILVAPSTTPHTTTIRLFCMCIIHRSLCLFDRPALARPIAPSLARRFSSRYLDIFIPVSSSLKHAVYVPKTVRAVAWPFAAHISSGMSTVVSGPVCLSPHHDVWLLAAVLCGSLSTEPPDTNQKPPTLPSKWPRPP